jgi:hypothetical protein
MATVLTAALARLVTIRTGFAAKILTVLLHMVAFTDFAFAVRASTLG